LLSLIALGACALGIIIGWKVRHFWDNRPRIMRWGKKKDEPGVAPLNGTPDQGGGIVNGLSRTGGRIIGKGLETVFGKPKGPKDDKEKK
jgi:hypothetical protein